MMENGNEKLNYVGAKTLQFAKKHSGHYSRQMLKMYDGKSSI